MRYSIRHQTRYIYSGPASISHNRLCSKPRACPWQVSPGSSLQISPEPAFLNHQYDYYRNPVSFFTVQSPHRELRVVVNFEAEVKPRPIIDWSESWEAAAEHLKAPSCEDAIRACQFRFDSTWVKRSQNFTAYAKKSFPKGRALVEGSLDLCRRIYEDFEFNDQATDVATPLTKVFKNRKGVCQDFAHLAVAGLRGLGLAARYVSGYIRTIPPPGQERMQGADASHAWLSVWTPQGWLDLDPTNNCRAGQDHITLAWGRDYHDVCPLRGVVLGGGNQKVDVGVDVIPLDEKLEG